jgi:hypothetical protein
MKHSWSMPRSSTRCHKNPIEETVNSGTVTILNDDRAKLLAAEKAKGPHRDVELLTEEQLDPIVDEAIRRWSAVLGDDIDVAAVLGGIEFQIVDFKGYGRGILGMTTPDIIYIDADAAGWGWYVDDDPSTDDEFDDEGGEDAGRMDLLTAVMHEMGHVLGYADAAADADNLMSGTLDAGERLVVMDTSDLIDDVEEEAWTGSKQKEKDSWLINFLMKNARENANPFEPREIIRIVMADDEIEEEA